MSVENFNYRTSPLFLRNEFDSDEKWAMPKIPKSDFSDLNADLRLIGFDKVKTDNDEHYQRAVHFFLYDYKFEDIWKNPDKYVDVLKKYKAVLTPDFSMYIEMNPVLQLYNTFRNRWIGAYLSSKGIRVISTVNWGLENTFDFCFNGIEKGSTVAVSTYMVSESDHHKNQKEFFLNGYNEMLKRIKPEMIICYHEPFPEMEGNILYINYELSSWQHYSDDNEKCYVKTTGNTKKYFVHKIFKGTGSAFGGEWKPKKEDDERFLGKPGEIKRTHSNTVRGGYDRDTKYGEDGKAVLERHYSDHGRPDIHSSIHDHLIDWSKNYPHLLSPINYFDGNVPEFKAYKGAKAMSEDNIIYVEDHRTPEEYFEQNRFKTIDELKHSTIHGAEIEFEYNGRIYFIDRDFQKENVRYFIFEIYDDDTVSEDTYYDTVEKLLDHEIDGHKLREIATELKVWSRPI